MGLDMYAVVIEPNPKRPATDFKIDEGAEDLHYWRKHPNLHGFMQELYEQKGGEKEFNCNPVLLEESDLDALEKAIRQSELPDTTGFFFGESDGSEKADDLEFIEKARAKLAAGMSVAYYAWW